MFSVLVCLSASFIILLLFYWYYPFTVNISVCLYFMSLVNSIYLNFVSSLAIAYINHEYYSLDLFILSFVIFSLYLALHVSYLYLLFNCLRCLTPYSNLYVSHMSLVLSVALGILTFIFKVYMVLLYIVYFSNLPGQF